MTDRSQTKMLADRMRQSETDPFLTLGPTAPSGWVYRDFHPMPRGQWLTLLDLLGDANVQVISANSRQLPPAAMCRAQIWISPEGQLAWARYLGGVQNV